MSDSDDDAPLIQRGNAKGAARAPAVKKEQGAAAKAAKEEVKEEDAPVVKGPQGKDAGAKAKGQDTKPPPAAKGKATVKVEDATQNGKAAAAPKKVKEESKQPKEKKEYDMPGQTREPPPETDALRKFYTSLLEQRPESEMAKKWCLMYGLLSREDAEEVMAQLKKSKPTAKSPAKPSARSDNRGAATKPRRPADKAPAPAAKRQRQAVSPPKKTRAKYSDEEGDDGESSEEEEEDDDDEPIGRAKPAAKAAPKGAAAPKAAAGQSGAAKRRPIKGKDNAFRDGGLDDSDDDDDDLPLMQRNRK